MNRVKKLRNDFHKAWICKDQEESIDLLGQVIELDHEYLDAYVLRAMRLTQSGRCSYALSDLEKASKISPGAIKIHFVRAYALLKQKEYFQVIEQVTEILEKVSSREDLVKSNPNFFKAIFDEYNCLKLTVDEHALCYLFRADSIAHIHKYYDLSLSDIRKAASLKITNLVRDEIENLRRELQEEVRKIELAKEIRRKSKLSFRLKNSLSSYLALWFWGLSAFCIISAITCFFYGETMTAYKLFGLGLLTSPPVIITTGWGVYKSYSSWDISKIERSAYAFFVVVFLILSYISIPSTFASRPAQPKLSIQVGSDSDKTVDSMKDYAKLHGGDVYCQTLNGYSCTYTAPNGERTTIYIDVESTGVGRNPTKGTVTKVE